jgi:hypothetical protein
MKTRLVFVAVMLCLVLLAFGAPDRVMAVCSGDDCGCYDDEPACEAACNGNQTCIHSCVQAAVHCAVCCCSECPYAPLYCHCTGN